jgi:creatinine amidohydrolase
MPSEPVDAPRRWAELTAPGIGELWPDGNTDVGILPVGATEQHGPHLPTGTDTILACALADRVSARTGAVVLPPMPIGCSYGHGTQIPGTLSLTPEHLTSIVLDVIKWGAHSGMRRVLIINTHYGNAASLSMASDHLRLQRPDLRIGIVDWWSATDELRSQATMDASDLHANRAETSLMLAVAPHLVHTDLAATADDMPNWYSAIRQRNYRPTASRVDHQRQRHQSARICSNVSWALLWRNSNGADESYHLFTRTLIVGTALDRQEHEELLVEWLRLRHL